MINKILCKLWGCQTAKRLTFYSKQKAGWVDYLQIFINCGHCGARK